ncbi:MAG TPA: hypothetical protein VN632_06710 [Stellaceae bacterium]|nr:hypothetical protein [Stellaceae bacterium]
MMIDLAFGILAAAALIGAGLAVAYAYGASARNVGRAVPTIHAAIGAAGFAVLIAALRAGSTAASRRMGTAGFDFAAAAFLVLALLVGVVIGVRAWRRKSPGGMLIGIHATLAVAGVTLLLAVVALG